MWSLSCRKPGSWSALQVKGCSRSGCGGAKMVGLAERWGCGVDREYDGVDVARPNPARIYDYWLGGSHNFAADRAVAKRAAAEMPTLKAAILANRAFLRRVVKHLAAECGIRQFLDLGSGVPTIGDVHEIAQQVDPECRVVYVDIEPVAVAHSRQILADNPNARTIQADFRTPAAILDHPRVREILDLTQPVAVLMIAVLHFIPDDQDPGGIVRGYLRRIGGGSYLALSHAAPDIDHPQEQAAMIAEYQRSTGVQFLHRTPEDLGGWLAGTEIQPPGIVLVNQWRPDSDAESILRTYGVLARKP
jgi:S-adenosyl methyltransferase